MHEPKKGFTNYHFNKLSQDKLLTAYKGYGDFSGLAGPWGMVGTIQLADRASDFTVTMQEGADGLTEVKISRNQIDDAVKPLGDNLPIGELQLPQGSGGLLVSLYQYRRLLTLGKDGFEQGFDHNGWEPCYPPKPDGQAPAKLGDLRVDCEVVRTKHGSFESKWYFDKTDKKLIACEATITKEEDPCELYFADYKPVDGRQLPHRIEVRHGDKRYAVLTIKAYKLAQK
jgi:hypothetical protein